MVKTLFAAVSVKLIEPPCELMLPLTVILPVLLIVMLPVLVCVMPPTGIDNAPVLVKLMPVADVSDAVNALTVFAPFNVVPLCELVVKVAVLNTPV